MVMPSPELVQALGVAVAAVLTAWQARSSAKIRDLEQRMRAVEAERDRFRNLFRSAVRHIRDWMSWSLHRAGSPPELPAELRDEV